ncbi:hypothetical protein AQUCO_01700020v1 [Aquilegia coerulea]|uniref:Uncharacterized protein n=1 Tax=Aquilegia coerulea TaxID=218851 RepID=A0A2G5DKU2_AQUCA|nr:hypothetical protein AQUCO_01700020v1 [Aquilegia coerulea]
MATQAVARTQLNVNANTTATDSSKRNDAERSRKPLKKNKQRSSSSLSDCSINQNEGQSSITCPYPRSLSLSEPTECTQATLEARQNRSFMDKKCTSLPAKSNFGSSLSQLAKYPIKEESDLVSLKARHNDRGISWRWLRIRKGIRTKKLISPSGRRSVDSFNKQLATKENSLQAEVLPSDEDRINEIDPLGENISTGFSFKSDYLAQNNHQDKCKNNRNREKAQCQSSSSLNSKYYPKLFEDIAGNEIIVKALSNAVLKEKIAPLYLFHGPSGTGKTSTAKIFSMALNCESSTHTKPCWSCRGCTRSLYIMDLCSGSRISGFERIKTLLQSTSFTQIVTGFKVFIIEECHTLMEEAWEEILTIVERNSGSAVVFVMITEDVKMVPKGISSRCQKFCFPKLKDMDITLKLARIVAREEIEIERDALRLIISKADGSMREAENILDQLALLGSRITSAMVQQIVGLVPHNKLLDLLTTVLSADTIKTVRSTRELIASGVQPQSILSQLASLITDILSGASAIATTSSAGSSKDKRLSRSGSQLTNDQSERLSQALKKLVETEKQLSSSNDQTNWIVAALLQVESEHLFNRSPTGIVLPRDFKVSSDCKPDTEGRRNSADMQRDEVPALLPRSRSISKTKSSSSSAVERACNLGQIGNMEEVWKNMLDRIQSQYVRDFLCQQAKIASLTISSANAIVHLMFKRPEDKLAAQMSEDTIAYSLKTSFGCPVIVNMSLEPIHMEAKQRSSVSTTKGKQTECCHCTQHQSSEPFLPSSESPCSQRDQIRCSGSRKSSAAPEHLRSRRMPGYIQTSQGQDKFPSETRKGSTTQPQEIPFSGPLRQGTGATLSDPENDPSAREQNPSTKTDIKKTTNSRHRWLSLSSIQQGDASVEQYSQDLLFENENNDRERGKYRHSKLHKGSAKDNEDHHYQHSATPL